MAAILKGMDTPEVNTQDLGFQADPQCKPDKESTWQYPKEQDGWVYAHNSIRMEVDKLVNVLKHLGDRTLHEWERAELKEWWAGHAEHIHGHHTNEDDILGPELRKRINLPERLETDHVGLVEALEELRVLMATVVNASHILDKVEAYRALLFPHLKEEEQISLPLVRAYYTQTEFAAVVHKILSKAGKLELGSFFHHMGSKKDIQAFMKQEGIPFFVWYLQFKPLRDNYRKKMESRLESLLRGGSYEFTHKRDLAGVMGHDAHFNPPSSPAPVRSLMCTC